MHRRPRRRPARIGPVVLVLAVLALALGACGSGSTPEVEAGPGGTADPELVEGRRVYIASCARCHGNDGGGGSGPRLAGRMEERFADPADQEAVVRRGPGLMPSFDGQLSDAEIAAVVRFTREVLE